MVWTSSGSISLSSDWQYTEPIPSGSFFRLKHTEAPNGGLFAIAQCEIDADGKLSLVDSQVLAVEKPITDVLEFSFPGCFAERRIAIKKLPRQPSLQQELRRLFLPGYLQPTEEEIRIVSRSNWSIEVQVSDFLEPAATVDLTSIHTKLDALAASIEALQNSSNTPVPTTETDPNFSNVVLLLHMDGTNGSTVFTDTKGKTVDAFGNAQISTFISKFGGASGYFDGSGDYLSIADNPDFNFGSGDFTIEGWLYPSATNQAAILERRSTGFTTGDWVIFYNNQQIELAVQDINSAGNAVLVSIGGDTPINAWSHFAISRNGDTWRLFINGIVKDTKSYSQSISNNSQPLTIGRDVVSGGRFHFAGYLDDFRISKGIARYTTDFIPSTVAFPNN